MAQIHWLKQVRLAMLLMLGMELLTILNVN